ncbi:MAG: hypothetical protein HYY18_10235 [Planctomycetes bacterium]|nr:hypothetical protein [Planctomycetota bacterium]
MGYPPGQMPPQAPAKSGGCFKGCCIAAVILAVLGVIGMVIIGTQWKKWMGSLAIEGIIKPSDMTEAEKKEASDMIPMYIEALEKSKVTQAQFQEIMESLDRAGKDQKYEAKELRPIFGKMKAQLKAAGYSLPSELFPPIAEIRSEAEGKWQVVVRSVPKGKVSESAAAIAQAMKVPESGAKAMLKDLPSTVMEGVTKGSADALAAKLRAEGCEVDVTEKE